MAWWEWAIVLGLWAWAMVDNRRLRLDVDAGLRAIDQRRIDAVAALQSSTVERTRPGT